MATHTAALPTQPAPLPVPTSVEAAAAERTYKACLVHAARYADTSGAGAGGLATLITPMCYPQFAAFRATAETEFSDHERARYDAASDQRQLELAQSAITEERSQAALQTTP
jgi:hypothetical protein